DIFSSSSACSFSNILADARACTSISLSRVSSSRVTCRTSRSGPLTFWIRSSRYAFISLLVRCHICSPSECSELLRSPGALFSGRLLVLLYRPWSRTRLRDDRKSNRLHEFDAKDSSGCNLNVGTLGHKQARKQSATERSSSRRTRRTRAVSAQ